MRSASASFAATLAISTLFACAGDNFTAAPSPGAAGSAGNGSPAGGATAAGNGGSSAGNGGSTAGNGGSSAGTGGGGSPAMAGAGGSSGGGAAGSDPGGSGGTPAGSGGASGGSGQGGAETGGAGGASAGAGGQPAGGGGQGGAAQGGSGGAAGSDTGSCPVLYVSAQASPGGNGCAKTAPLSTISLAFATAKTKPEVKAIWICDGSYQETALTLDAPVTVSGSRKCDDWSAPPLANAKQTTVVRFTGDVGLTLPDTLPDGAFVERIHLENAATSDGQSTGVLVGKNKVKLREIRVSSAGTAAQAAGTPYASAGLFVRDGSSADIADCVFFGGPGTSDMGVGSVGAWLEGSGPDLSFARNDLFGGRGATGSDRYPGSAGLVVRARSGTTTLAGPARIEGGSGVSSNKPQTGEPPFGSTGMFIELSTNKPAEVHVIDSSVAGGFSRGDKENELQAGQTRGIDASGKDLTLRLTRARVYGGDHVGALPGGSSGVSTKTEAVRMIGGKVDATSSLIHGGGLADGTFYPRAITIEGKGATFVGRFVTVLPGKIAPKAVDGIFDGGNALVALVKAESTLVSFEDSLLVAQALNTSALYAQDGACGGPGYSLSLTRTRYVHPESASASGSKSGGPFIGGANPCSGVPSMPVSGPYGSATITNDGSVHVGDAGVGVATASTLTGCASSATCFSGTVFPSTLNAVTREQVLARTSARFTPPCGLGAGISTAGKVDAPEPIVDLVGTQRGPVDKTVGALSPLGCPSMP